MIPTRPEQPLLRLPKGVHRVLISIASSTAPDQTVGIRCDALLSGPIRELFRLQNVSTRRRDRINSDEEERQRQGYDVRSTYESPELMANWLSSRGVLWMAAGSWRVWRTPGTPP